MLAAAMAQDSTFLADWTDSDASMPRPLAVMTMADLYPVMHDFLLLIDSFQKFDAESGRKLVHARLLYMRRESLTRGAVGTLIRSPLTSTG